MKRLVTDIFSAEHLHRLPLIAIIMLVIGNSDALAQRYSTDRPDGRHVSQNPYCRELERKLASDWVRGRKSGDLLPGLKRKIRKQDGIFNRLQNKADRMDCYENMFIFGRSLRRTKKCLAIDRKIRGAKRKLARLEEERSSLKDQRRSGSRRKRILAELSRNNCGEQYRYEARRNSSNWLEESGLGELFGGSPRPQRRQPQRDEEFNGSIQPYATYRTMCVRLCDGYYFPVSFSTLPSSFPKDIDVCQSKCAAPAELYVYRNPGGEVEQMASPNGSPYDSLKNAWRYRKEYIKGCSCKKTEYSEADIDAHNNPQKQASNTEPVAEEKSVKPTVKKNKSQFDNVKTIDDLIR